MPRKALGQQRFACGFQRGALKFPAAFLPVLHRQGEGNTKLEELCLVLFLVQAEVNEIKSKNKQKKTPQIPPICLGKAWYVNPENSVSLPHSEVVRNLSEGTRVVSQA